MQPIALISAEAKKSPIKDISNYMNDIQAYFHKYDWLCHLTIFLNYNNFGTKKGAWPSDKTNHTCENMLYVIFDR